MEDDLDLVRLFYSPALKEIAENARLSSRNTMIEDLRVDTHCTPALVAFNATLAGEKT